MSPYLTTLLHGMHTCKHKLCLHGHNKTECLKVTQCCKKSLTDCETNRATVTHMHILIDVYPHKIQPGRQKVGRKKWKEGLPNPPVRPAKKHRVFCRTVGQTVQPWVHYFLVVSLWDWALCSFHGGFHNGQFLKEVAVDQIEITGFFLPPIKSLVFLERQCGTVATRNGSGFKLQLKSLLDGWLWASSVTAIPMP